MTNPNDDFRQDRQMSTVIRWRVISKGSRSYFAGRAMSPKRCDKSARCWLISANGWASAGCR